MVQPPPVWRIFGIRHPLRIDENGLEVMNATVVRHIQIDYLRLVPVHTQIDKTESFAHLERLRIHLFYFYAEHHIIRFETPVSFQSFSVCL